MGVKSFFTLILPSFLQQDRSQKICNITHTVLTCHFYEFLFSGLFYILLGILCLIFLRQHFSQMKLLKQNSFDFNKWFWISVFIWCIYHAIFEIFYINWTVKYYYIFYVCLDSILLFIPSLLFIAIISETLFVYRNPGTLIHNFSRILFCIFFFIYLIFGGLEAYIKSIGEIDSYKNDFFHLWLSCYDILMFCFIFMPTYQLIQALSTPVVLLEDSIFIKKMKIGLTIICLIYLTCAVFNMLSYCGVNPAYNTLKDNIKNANNSLLDFKKRYIYILLEIFFNCDKVIMLILGVKLIRQHDLSFVEDPFETQVRSDCETNPGA